jgi:hypothetical protein
MPGYKDPAEYPREMNAAPLDRALSHRGLLKA